jgi:hypothetical protein
VIIPPITGDEFTPALDMLCSGLSQVLFPIVVLLGLTGLAVGILNVHDHFTIPAIAPLASATIVITMRIAEGMHINAHEPGAEFLIPLRVHVIGGEGLEAAVDYPQGVLTAFEGADEQMKAHFGTVAVKVQLRRTGPMSERPKLSLTYQPCTDKACLAPVTDLLPVRIMPSN